MAEKRYDSDWAKAKSRDLVKALIERSLRFRQPKDIRVLCFPGIDATEIFQVYDSLGIPRSNIVGVEREAEIADKIGAKDLGIRLERTTLEDYVASQSQIDFDIVSLDYTGPVSAKQDRTAIQIVSKQQRNHFVFHTANSFKRDANSGFTYFEAYAHSTPVNVHGKNVLDPSFFDSILAEEQAGIANRMAEFIGASKTDSGMKLYKISSYALITKSALAGGTLSSNSDLLKFITGDNYSFVVRMAEEILAKSGVNIHLDEENPFGSIKSHPLRPLLTNFLEFIVWKCLNRAFEINGIDDLQVQLVSLMALNSITKQRKDYHIVNSEHYSYTSESGTPMLGDAYFLTSPTRLREITQDIAYTLGYPIKFKMLLPNEEGRLFELTRAYVKERNRTLGKAQQGDDQNDEANRIYLGSSAKPIITRDRAIEAFRSGSTIDDMMVQFRGWKPGRLRAWHHYFERGAYEPQDLDHNRGDIGKVSKEEAIYLISEGIPPQEVFEAYPTSFTLGQLRGFKASITKGIYNDKNSSRNN